MAFFISYSHKDKTFFDELIRRMEEQDIVHLTDQQIIPGEDWRRYIDALIEDSIGMIVIISPNSLQSQYVTYEWAYAMGLKKPIIPVLLEEGGVIHPKLEPKQYIKVSGGDLFWDKLLSHLQNLKAQTVKLSQAIQNALSALDNPSPEVRLAAIETLEQNEDPAAIDALAQSVNNPLPDVSIAAAFALAKRTEYQDIRCVPGLRKALSLTIKGRYFEDQKETAIRYLGEIGNEEATQYLIEGLKNWEKRYEPIVVRALGKTHNQVAIPTLLKYLNTPLSEMIDIASKSLSELGFDHEDVLHGLEQRFISFRAIERDSLHPCATYDSLARNLTKLNENRAKEFLIHILRDSQTNLDQFVVAANILGEIGDRDTIQELIQIRVNFTRKVAEYSALSETIETLQKRLDRTT